MALEHFFEDMATEYSLNEDEVSLKTWNSKSLPIDESGNDDSSGFDCSICLDSVQDPVVTLCGHLYCWPCIYKWISHDDHEEPRCPVCKAPVSDKTLVPLYGRGGRDTKSCDQKGSKLDNAIPNRPRSPRCIASPMVESNLNVSHPYINVTHPGVGMFGEMVYARIFGNSEANFVAYRSSYNLAGTGSRRIRRHIMEVDRSLNRVSFFLFCCMVLCLLMF